MKTYPLPLKRMALLAGVLSVTGGCAQHTAFLDSIKPIERVEGPTAEVTRSDPLEKATAHFRAGRYGLAVERFQTALAKNPASIRALNGLGACFDQLGRFELAQAYYYRALDLEGDSVQTLNNLGYSLVLQERYGEAVQVLSTARGLEAGNPHVRRNLAKAQKHLFAGLGGDKERPTERAGPSKVAVVREDMQAAKAAKAEPEPKPRDYEVVVANGNGRNGMAYLTSRYLKTRGVEVADIRNAGHFNYERTRLYYRPGFEDAAQEVASLLRLPVSLRERRSEDTEADVQIVLGEDFMMYDRALRTAVLEDAGASVDEAETEGLLAAAVEVSNGNGRTGMAALVGRALGADGSPVARLTNARSFDRRQTTLYFRAGARKEAERLARTLPVEAVLKESEEMREDIGVRILIGRDLLGHEESLRERAATHA